MYRVLYLVIAQAVPRYPAPVHVDLELCLARNLLGPQVGDARYPGHHIVDLGGFFGAAAWITIISQGGQYLATWLARIGLGRPDLNVVLAISTSAVVNALAVSGVAWLQPIYLVVSLSIGLTMLSFGLFSDARNALVRSAGRALS